MKTVIDVIAVAEDLAHPEGPALLADGAIVFVETYREQVSVWRAGQAVSQFADCGGGPNACCAGDDAVYITQIGASVGARRSSRPAMPSIQKLRNGQVETLLTSVAGESLKAPNDLCFGRRGNLCFTDPGEFNPDAPAEGYIYSIAADGSCDFVEEVGPVFPNGVIALPDDSIVWAESYTRRIRRRDSAGTVTDIARLPAGHMPDGLKAGEDGRLYVASIMSGGIDVVDLRNGEREFLRTGGHPLNCLFVGRSLYVADDGVATGASATSPIHLGRLLRIDLDAVGMSLFSGSVKGVPEA
jgi:gluconolactonase